MAGLIKRHINEEELDPNTGLEEQYEKLFPKIGRDFVYKEDLYRVLHKLILMINPASVIGLEIKSDIHARQKALEYKAILDNGKDGSKIYKDLINLDED